MEELSRSLGAHDCQLGWLERPTACLLGSQLGCYLFAFVLLTSSPLFPCMPCPLCPWQDVEALKNKITGTD
jgi:hypothetical protein